MPIEAVDFSALLRTTPLNDLIRQGIPPGYYAHLPSTKHLPRVSVPLGQGIEDVMYVPTIKQSEFHSCQASHCILEGPRGTGKSKAIRYDAHMRALSHPNFVYLIIRRIMNELEQSHLIFIRDEMEKFGGDFHGGKFIARYPNGSLGFFTHCEQEADIAHLLSSEYGAIYFDEMTTFKWVMITKISASARVTKHKPWKAVIRGGTNPAGIGAADVQKYYIDHSVRPEEDQHYDPKEWVSIKTTMDDNPHLDKASYEKELQHLPEHIRRAWLMGEWLVEGAYFTDFKPIKDGRPWHVIPEMPRFEGRGLFDTDQYGRPYFPWINVYRSLDWGYQPDPCVCHWYVVMPDGSAVVFKERKWLAQLAKDVAGEIAYESRGMNITQTFADPSIFGIGKGSSTFSVGEIFEQNGVSLTKSINDRALFGYAIHDAFNTIIDGRPKLRILAPQPDPRLGCPELIRTLPAMQTDKTDATKIAEGEDHYVASLAYFCIGQAPASQNPHDTNQRPRWMRPKGLRMYSFVKV